MFFKKINYIINCTAISVLLVIVVHSTVLAGNQYGIEYDKATELISFNVKNVSLKKTLKNVASVSGVIVFFDPEIEKRITLELKNMKLDKGLKRLLKLNNYAMTYEKVTNIDGSQEMRLKKVSVFKNSQKDTVVLTGIKESRELVSHASTETSVKSVYDSHSISSTDRANLTKEERMELKQKRKRERKKRTKERKARAKERREKGSGQL